VFHPQLPASSTFFQVKSRILRTHAMPLFHVLKQYI
jgi:hypothetical protein